MKPQEAFQKTSQRIVGNHALLALLLHRRCNFAFDDHDSTLLPDALSMCRGGAGYTPETITRETKIEARRRRNRVSETPESHQNQAEIALEGSRGAQECPRALQERYKIAHDSPKWAQVGPNLVPTAPKLAPSWSQERPSWRQVGPKSAQVEAKNRPRSSKLTRRGAVDAPS